MWLINYLFSRIRNASLNNGSLTVNESIRLGQVDAEPALYTPPPFEHRFMASSAIIGSAIRSYHFDSLHSHPHSKYGCMRTDPAICSPFIYQPIAFKNIEEEPKHGVIGTYLCGDCVGILAWDSASGASFAYHMKDCDDELLALALARFIMASGSNAWEQIKPFERILVNDSERTSDEKSKAIESILNMIKESNLLATAEFNLASGQEDNRPYIRNFLAKAGVRENQIREFNSFNAILDRRDGSVETDFEYNSKSDILRFNLPFANTAMNPRQENGARPY